MPNLRILEPFQAGLRNDDNPIGRNALLDAYGVECRETGLVAYEYVGNPLAVAATGRRHALFTVGTGCYLFDVDNAFKEISSSWGKTALTPLDYRESALGSELVTNGTFVNWTGWTGSSAAWGIPSTTAGAELSLQYSASYELAQTFTSSSTYACDAYLLTVDVDFGPELTTGTVYFEANAPLIVNNHEIWKSGTYKFLCPASSGYCPGITIHPEPGWTGVVNSVSAKAFSTVTLTSPMPVSGWNIASHPDGFICSGWDVSTDSGHPFYYDENIGLFYHVNMHLASICSHVDGRMYMAGKLGSFIRGDTAGYVWRRLTDGSLDMLSNETNPVLDDRCIYWSCIGMDDVPGIFFPYLETDEAFLNRWERNEAGFLLWPYPGTIYRLLSLADGVMAYGENGLAFLKPVFSPITVCTQELGAIPLAGRMAVCGNGTLHYFLDVEGALWRVTPGPKLERLGYSDILGSLTLSSTILVIHPDKDKLYISDGTTSYLLSQGRLVECPEHVYSLVSFSNEVAGTVKAISDSFEVETGVVDFGNRDVKTLSRITYDGFASSSGMLGKVFYRMNRGDAWTDTGWSTLPWEDRISAREFKFGAKANSSSSAYLSYLDVEFDADPSRYSLGEWV